MQKAEVFQITTEDKTPISATLFSKELPSKHLIIICPAAAAPQHYYRGFAEYASSYRDFDAITFDYRGIGDSLKTSLKKEQSTMSQWGEQDLNAVINWAAKKYDKICLIGHSVAGQIFPKAKAHPKILAAYFVSSQSAYFGHWKGWWKVNVLFFWYVMIPVMTALLGYLPGWAMGGKVALSKSAAKEWRKWGLHPEGVIQGNSELRKKFDAVKIHVHFVSMEDDALLAPTGATQALMNSYRNAKTSFQFIRPRDLKLDEIGHFGFFKRRFARLLWPMPIYFFSQYVNKLE